MTIPDDIAEQAAEWTVRLSSADIAESEAARAGFEEWRRANPLHEAAGAAMQRVIGRMESVRSAASGHVAPARAAFEAARDRDSFGDGRKAATHRDRSSDTKRDASRTRRVASVLCAVLVAGLIAIIGLPGSPLLADVRTATGQWETRTLPDGTRITLGSSSAVNLRFDARRRRIELIEGDILVDVAHDATRPFTVTTTHGRIRALGTRFTVDRQGGDTVLTMLESSVSVQTASQRDHKDRNKVIVQAGQRVRFTADAVAPVEDIDIRSVGDAWKFGQLVARERPLPEILDELARYRPGALIYDRAALQDIRMTVVLPLDDTDRALRLLGDSLPSLRVSSLTRYLVRVDLKPTR